VDTRGLLRHRLRQLLREEELPEPEDDFVLWAVKSQKVVLDVAWPEARVAILLEEPPYTGGAVVCQECGERVTREVPGTDKRLPVVAPNLSYRPDWQGYNLAVECGWALLRVDMNGLQNVRDPLVGLLNRQQAPQLLPGQGRIALQRGTVVGWLMAQSPAVTVKELRYRTGWSKNGCQQGMKILAKWLPIEQTEPGIWRWKRGETDGKD
jgi:hypothetical protein